MPSDLDLAIARLCPLGQMDSGMPVYMRGMVMTDAVNAFAPTWARVWMVARDGSVWGDLEFAWADVGCGPPQGHWLEYRLNCDVFHDAVDGGDPRDVEQWMLQNGLAPGQPFCVELRFSAWRSNTPDGDDYDEEVSWGEVVDRERWSAERTLDAWEALWFRQANHRGAVPTVAMVE